MPPLAILLYHNNRYAREVRACGEGYEEEGVKTTLEHPRIQEE